MEKMTCETFLRFPFLSSPLVSPDGRYTAYIRQKADLKTNGYQGNLWLYDHERALERQLTTLGQVKSFSWLDSHTVAFPGARGAETGGPSTRQKRTVWYVLDVEGGEAQPLVTVPVAAAQLAVLAEDRYLLLASFDGRAPDLEGLDTAQQEQALADYAARTSETFEDVPFWLNGAGITDRRRNRLCVYDAKTEQLTWLTRPLFKVMGFKLWEGKVLYIGSQFDSVQTLRAGAFLWDSATGETRCLLEQDRYLIKLFEVWNDKAILCLTDGLGYGNGQNGDLCTIDFNTGELALLLKHDHHCVGSTVCTDSKVGAGHTSAVDGDTLYYISTVDDGSRIEALDLKNGQEWALTIPGSVDFLDAASGRLSYLAFRGNGLGEVYTYEKGAEKQLTHAGDVLAGYTVSTPEYMEVDTGADRPIQGWVLKPADYQEGKKYPLILSIHGGPRLSYGSIFVHEMQMFAARGYFVVFCNPRGSEGRGNGFADIRGKFGSIDYDDIMGFLDGALARYPDMDSGHMGVSGGSYGGFMTNWIIGHTDRFRAACTQRSICDWTSMEGTADIGYYFVKGQIGASHREDHAKLWEHSPIRYIDRCTTPTLVIHGEQDYRCWTLQAYELFAALQMNGVPSRLCMFSGENHELSRSGRPRQKLRRLEEMAAWFDKYLKEEV